MYDTLSELYLFFDFCQLVAPIDAVTETDPCGPDKPQVVTDSPFGEIASPVVNGAYPNDANCQWRITVDAGFKIRLIFSEFATEGGYNT